MPRPKRAKITTATPAPMTTAVTTAQRALEPSPAAESVTSSRGATGSSDSDGLITRNPTRMNSKGFVAKEVFMSGALPVDDAGERRPRPLSTRKRVALSRIAREGDHARAYEALKARRDAALQAERLAKEAKQANAQIPSTQLSYDPAPKIVPTTAPAISPAQNAQPVRGSRTQATPLREHSVLDIQNFKRRPRQPSLLQVARAQVAAAESEDGDSLNDLEPDDESTPFGKSQKSLEQQPSSNSSRKRKLSTPEIQVPASQTQEPEQQSSSPVPSAVDDVLDSAAVEDSQPEPILPPIPASLPPTSQQAIHSDTLAPPRSSSPPPSPENKQSQKSSARTTRPSKQQKPTQKPKKQQPPQHPSITLPPRSPTPTQRAPTTANTSRTRSPLKPITTSTLQNLLPRRRGAASKNKENIGVFDIMSSNSSDPIEEDEDADELSYHASSRRPRATDKRGKGKGGKGNKKSGSAKTAAVGKTAEKRVGKTYTRKSALDVEDEIADEDAEGQENEGRGKGEMQMDAKAREEMKRLRDKFLEVDQWGLEFEEVSGSSDRMRDAR
ncbi:MAG: hypothetical protein Q9183_000360 [Haloplaca sp. 2 TL-2023]